MPVIIFVILFFVILGFFVIIFGSNFYHFVRWILVFIFTVSIFCLMLKFDLLYRLYALIIILCCLSLHFFIIRFGLVWFWKLFDHGFIVIRVILFYWPFLSAIVQLRLIFILCNPAIVTASLFLFRNLNICYRIYIRIITVYFIFRACVPLMFHGIFVIMYTVMQIHYKVVIIFIAVIDLDY
jgi:hypothetical protein